MRKRHIISILVMIFIAAMFTAFLPTTNTYAGELDDAAAKLEEAKNIAQEAQDRKDSADAAVEETQAKIAEIEAVLPAQQEQAAAVLKSIYKQNSSDLMMLMNAILNADDFAGMIRYIENWNYIAEYRESVLAESKNSLDELATQQESLIAEQQEADEALAEADKAKKEAQAAYRKAKAAASAYSPSATVDWNAASDGGIITLSQMKFQGVVNYAGYRYTYYSQSVLPGGGLRIPGRHVEKGCVVDGDGYICVASTTHPQGTIVPTPLVEFPKGKVYDSGCAYGTIDLYIA